MQNAEDLGVFYRCEDCAFLLHIISLRAQISQNVKYWYEICNVLVPIFHSEKFAKCEICGSTYLELGQIVFIMSCADPECFVRGGPTLTTFF